MISNPQLWWPQENNRELGRPILFLFLENQHQIAFLWGIPFFYSCPTSLFKKDILVFVQEYLVNKDFK
jgi:hypothetical protein